MDKRANAVREGKSFSADGILEGDEVNNVSYEVKNPRKHGLKRKDKYMSQDITEWAKHYVNKLLGDLKSTNQQSTTDKGAWDIDKHGLSSYLTGQGLTAQDVFEKYDMKDLFKLLGEGYKVGTTEKIEVNSYGDLFFNTGFMYRTKVKNYGIYITPTYYIPLVFMADTHGKVTYSSSLSGKLQANAEIPLTLYSVIDLEDIENFMFIVNNVMHFTVVESYERYRTVFENDEVEISVDEYPFGVCVEIENKSNNKDKDIYSLSSSIIVFSKSSKY